MQVLGEPKRRRDTSEPREEDIFPADGVRACRHFKPCRFHAVAEAGLAWPCRSQAGAAHKAIELINLGPTIKRSRAETNADTHRDTIPILHEVRRKRWMVHCNPRSQVVHRTTFV